MTHSKYRIELHVPSVLGFEKVAMDAASAVARQMGFEPTRVDDLRTAVAEACLNAMEHGNQFAQDSEVNVLMICEDDRLDVNVLDEGRGGTAPRITEPLTVDNPPLGTHGNMGMFLITQLMDEVEVTRLPEGSLVRMTIYLKHALASLAKIGLQ